MKEEKIRFIVDQKYIDEDGIIWTAKIEVYYRDGKRIEQKILRNNFGGNGHWNYGIGLKFY